LLQTKDFNCELITRKITEEGRLFAGRHGKVRGVGLRFRESGHFQPIHSTLDVLSSAIVNTYHLTSRHCYALRNPVNLNGLILTLK
jgi:hypothetical protein